MDAEEFSTVQDKEINAEILDNRQDLAMLPRMKNILQELARRVITFIVYGPGVIGFLWLIGRILKR